MSAGGGGVVLALLVAARVHGVELGVTSALDRVVVAHVDPVDAREVVVELGPAADRLRLIPELVALLLALGDVVLRAGTALRQSLADVFDGGGAGAEEKNGDKEESHGAMLGSRAQPVNGVILLGKPGSPDRIIGDPFV